LDNGLISLGELFDGCLLFVPKYQRAYAWVREPHLENFLDDLRGHPSDKNKKYFLGPILLNSTPRNADNDEPRSFAIVDGQQRLTTISIFVASAIKILAQEPSKDSEVKFYTRKFIKADFDRKFHTIPNDDGFFEQFIIGNSDSRAIQIDSLSQRRLLEASDFFIKKLNKIDTEEIIRILETLKSSQVLTYAVQSESEATQIFELQNDRGKSLTNLESLKSFLMHGLYMDAGPSTSNDLDILQNDFTAIYRVAEQMERKYDAPQEDRLLTYHCIAFEERMTVQNNRDGWDFPKQLVKLKLRSLEQSERSGWIKSFVRRLRNTFEIALRILDARDRDLSKPLGELTALGRTAAFWPLLLKSWNQEEDTSHYTNFNDAVSEMERLALRLILSGKRSDNGDSRLRILALEFRGDYNSLRAQLQNIHNTDDVRSAARNNLDSVNFYGWKSVATYILWKYENFLRRQTGRQIPSLSWTSIVTPERPGTRYAKDHIEPQNRNNPIHNLRVKWDDGQDDDKPFSEVCLNRLGNLVLDTISAGASKSDDCFEDRIEKYRGSGLISQGDIISKFASMKNGLHKWDLEAIQKRQNFLRDFGLSQI
jgi:hypothetical protein